MTKKNAHWSQELITGQTLNTNCKNSLALSQDLKIKFLIKALAKILHFNHLKSFQEILH